MRFLVKIKNKIHAIGKEFLVLFSYPVEKLSSEEVNYDTYWDARANSGTKLNKFQKERVEYVQEVIGNGEVSLVDIGCGNGKILHALKKRCIVTNATGIDISEKELEEAKTLGIETLNLDIQDKKDRSHIPEADHLLLFEMLEHIPDSEDLLLISYKKVRKGVFFSFPNTGYFKHRLRLLLGRFPLQWKVHPGEHVRFWTMRDVRWWMRALGFENYKLHGYRGVPVLNKVWPSLFAAGIFIYLPK